MYARTSDFFLHYNCGLWCTYIFSRSKGQNVISLFEELKYSPKDFQKLQFLKNLVNDTEILNRPMQGGRLVQIVIHQYFIGLYQKSILVQIRPEKSNDHQDFCVVQAQGAFASLNLKYTVISYLN